MTPKRAKIHAAFVLFAIVLAACTPVRPPVDELAAASRALAAARDAGAPQWADQDYRVADEGLRQAQAAMMREQYDEAVAFARIAEADAEFAAASARAAKTRAEVERLQAENDALARTLAQMESRP